MTDSELEGIYKGALGVSHQAGLRAVYEAGVASTNARIPDDVATPYVAPIVRSYPPLPPLAAKSKGH